MVVQNNSFTNGECENWSSQLMTDPVMIALMGERGIVSPCATLGGGDCGYKAQRGGGGEADPEIFCS